MSESGQSHVSAFSPVEVTDHLSPAVNKRLFVNTRRGGGRGAVCPTLDNPAWVWFLGNYLH